MLHKHDTDNMTLMTQTYMTQITPSRGVCAFESAKPGTDVHDTGGIDVHDTDVRG
jgi:hypothetical protein